MPIYEVKYTIGDKKLFSTVEADNEAMAKQKVYAKVYFVSIEEVPQPNKATSEFINFFNDITNGNNNNNK